MTKEGASLYSTSETPATPADFKISQGALESSNVQPVVEISHMIEIMRAYQATATMTQSHEDLLRQAIDKLGQQPNS
jgi:flagellar basal-body rod protein FlgF